MFPFADMLHFLANEFAGLSRWRFPLPSIFPRSFDRFLFWHRYKMFAAGAADGRNENYDRATKTAWLLRMQFSAKVSTVSWKITSRI
jgi:hypothetical protein